MKILFTGASSFTGMWFACHLAELGHEVTTTFTRPQMSYQGPHSARLQKIIAAGCRPVFDCTFGSDRFLGLIDEQESWDILCHHAAEVTHFRSPDFDPIHAVTRNTCQLSNVCRRWMARKGWGIVLTGSIFEPNEGMGTQPFKAMFPYGLSKGLTADVFRYYADIFNLKLGKFVIPNPFGPYENANFTSYLIKSWRQHEVPVVQYPKYVRDNIHVSLLTKVYGQFVGALTKGDGFVKVNPSGYSESLGTFTERFANEMSRRLDLACPFELRDQTDFPEPAVRINTDKVFDASWTENEAWNELATWYQR